MNTDEDLAAAAILVWMASGGHENAQSQVPVAGASGSSIPVFGAANTSSDSNLGHSADIQEQADEDHVTVESSGAAKRRFVRAMKRELLGLNHERANPPRALNRPARTGNTVGVELTTPSAGLPGTASSEMEEEEQEESHQPREERETGDEEEPQHKYKRLPEEKGDVFRW